MAAIEHSVDISRSPGEVFPHLVDLSHFNEWQEGVVSARLEGGEPLRVGSKGTVTRRVGPRERTMTIELTEYSPPRSYAFRGIDGPIRPTGRGTVEPLDGAGSRVTLHLDFEGHGLGKVLVPLVRRQARKEVPKDHENLKRRIETGAV